MNLAGRESSVKLATYGNVKISLLLKVNAPSRLSLTDNRSQSFFRDYSCASRKIYDLFLSNLI